MGNLSATVVRMKSPYEGGVDESLLLRIAALIARRSAKLPEKRGSTF